ncbi:MAG TPA: ATP synthase F1 subunit gamma, partial [Caulobacteraceae bacterium]
MASLKELRNRIASVKATQKITKAMQMVAAAKLRLAQDQAQNARPYAQRMAAVIANLAAGVSGAGAPRLLVGTGEDRNHLVVVATSDRGLAGGFNAQVIRRALALQREAVGAGQEVVWFSTGRKAASTLRFRRLKVIQSWTGFSERPAYRDAQVLAHAVSEAFVNGEVDRVVVVYNAFISALTQRVTVRELLPISQELIRHAVEAE